MPSGRPSSKAVTTAGLVSSTCFIMAAALCFAPDVVGIIGMATDHGAEVALRTELTPNTWREKGNRPRFKQ